MPESQTVTVCRLVADDWQAYRAIRLAMLEESPSAFGSTYAQAASFDEQLWRRRLAENVVFLARVGTSSAGSAMYSDSWAVTPTGAHLVGMWVDPRFRGTGVGVALVDAVIAQSLDVGKRRVILCVVESNRRARALYERCGFLATGHTGPYPHDDQLHEVEMELLLDGVAASPDSP